MAETAANAFGRYLKTLRERRRLSLQDVATLSQTFADAINKGYLSKCENGHQRLAFSKVIALSRIYEAPADALLERMELDLELDRVGGPETEGRSFDQLTKAAREALIQGYRWKGYGYLRDATRRAAVDTPTDGFRDQEEQIACAVMSCGMAASHLGRNKYAVHEYSYVESTQYLGQKYHAVLLGRLTHAYRGLGDSEAARQYAERAVTEAESCDTADYLGYAYADRAEQALHDSDSELAIANFQRAHKAFAQADLPHEAARTLNNVAQVYFDLRQYRAARHALGAAEKLLSPLGLQRSLALTRILLGEIEALEERGHVAERRWKEASDIAKTLNDKVLRFKAEYLLLRQAHENGNQPVSRSITRRLRRLAAWIPKDTPELAAFDALVQKNRT